MHDAITVVLPLLAILAGILLNRSDAKDLRGEIKDVRGEIKDVRTEIKDVRGEIKELRGEMNVRFNAVDAELRYFHGLQENWTVALKRWKSGNLQRKLILNKRS